MSDSLELALDGRPLPFSRAYVDGCLQIWRESADEKIEELAPEKRGKVADFCSELGINDEGVRTVLAITCDLIDFEAYGRELVLTSAQRHSVLTFIRDAPRGLTEAIGELSRQDRIALEVAVEGITREFRGDQNSSTSRLFFVPLALGAQGLLNESQDDKGKGGRRPLRVEYSRYVESLAYVFDMAGLPVGRGGAFERLCATVFDVAGVHATPEGAIRYYLTERKKLAPKQPENSSDGAAE